MHIRLSTDRAGESSEGKPEERAAGGGQIPVWKEFLVKSNCENRKQMKKKAVNRCRDHSFLFTGYRFYRRKKLCFVNCLSVFRPYNTSTDENGFRQDRQHNGRNARIFGLRSPDGTSYGKEDSRT